MNLRSPSVDSHAQPRICRLSLKETCIITIIALPAILLVVAGLLAVLAALPNGGLLGLGTISQIGWPIILGGSLTAGCGLLITLGLIVTTCYLYYRSPKKPNASLPAEIDAKDKQPVPTPYIPPEQSLVTPPQPKSSPIERGAQSSLQWKLPFYFPQYLLPRVNGYLEKNNIDCDARIENIYGKNVAPEIKLPLYAKDDEVIIRSLENQLFLIFHADADILSLSLDKVGQFKETELDILYYRLLLIDRKPHQKSRSIGSLGAWRSNTVTDDLPIICYGMLKAEAIEERLQKNQGDISLLLPTQPKSAAEYTRERMAALSEETLMPLLIHFSDEQLRLLPTHYFASEAFPWAAIINSSTENRLHSLLETRYDGNSIKRNRTKEILAVLHSRDTIELLAPHLKADHLPLFQEKVLEKDWFPWKIFIGKRGIGAAMHYMSLKVLLLEHIPWKMLVERKDGKKEVQALLKLDSYDHGTTKTILPALSIQAIRDLAIHMTAEHLPLFRNKLKEIAFPWEEFFKKPEIGAKLYNLSPDVLLLDHIPWKQLAMREDGKSQVQAFLYLGHRSYQENTEKILPALSIQAIRDLAPCLTADYLPLFRINKLKEKGFPWELFFEMEKIAQMMRNSYVIPALHGEHFPWTKLPTPLEWPLAPVLFSRHKDAKATTESILHGLTIPTIELLFERKILTREQHMELLNLAQRAHMEKILGTSTK